MISELVDYWTETHTTAQSISQLIVYVALVSFSGWAGWFLRGQIKGNK